MEKNDLISLFPDLALWDLLDDVIFWIKDTDGTFLWVNQAFAEQAGAERAAVIGTKDDDWFFNELASVFMRDDAQVAGGGKPLVNKPELVMRMDGDVAWHSTSKFPFRDRKGKILGTCGMSRLMEGETGLPVEYADLSEIITRARANLGKDQTVERLARSLHLSVSTLERCTRRYLGMTPQCLLRRIRMHRARHLLTSSSLRIGEIALACGYESFSAFSRAFRKHYGRAPGWFRSPSGSPLGDPRYSGPVPASQASSVSRQS